MRNAASRSFTSRRFGSLPRRCLLRWRYLLLVVTAGVVVASLLMPRPVDFDRKVVNLIASNSGVLDDFRRLKRSFGGNEIVLASLS